MSTRSAIIRETDDGFAGVYCHFDGYLSNNGNDKPLADAIAREAAGDDE